MPPVYLLERYVCKYITWFGSLPASFTPHSGAQRTVLVQGAPWRGSLKLSAERVLETQSVCGPCFARMEVTGLWCFSEGSLLPCRWAAVKGV